MSFIDPPIDPIYRFFRWVFERLPVLTGPLTGGKLLKKASMSIDEKPVNHRSAIGIAPVLGIDHYR